MSQHVVRIEVVDDEPDPVELLRRMVLDWGQCDKRATCDCSDAQAWRWLVAHGVVPAA